MPTPAKQVKAKCVNPDCAKTLTGLQERFCSERCKQRVKYAVKTGRMCKSCQKEMKPKPVVGGYAETCSRRCERAEELRVQKEMTAKLKIVKPKRKAKAK